MSVRPYFPDTAIATAVATAIAASKHTGKLLCKTIADTVETEISSSKTLDKIVLIAEVVFNVGTQIKFEHVTSTAGADVDTKQLADEIAEQTNRMYKADPRALYATDDDFIEASSRRV